MKSPISEDTRAIILDAAWKLIAEHGDLNVSLPEIAAAAGVSRQTLYLAFRGRSGLLVAMIENKDRQSSKLKQMIAIRERDKLDVADFDSYLNLWLDYLPEIYPVAILIEAAGGSDPAATKAYVTRMHDRLRMALRRLVGEIDRAGLLRPDFTAERAADIVWSLVHPTAWRLLVVECGWTPEEFRASRHRLVRHALLAPRT